VELCRPRRRLRRRRAPRCASPGSTSATKPARTHGGNRFRDSKDPRIFVPIAEDVAALLGVVVAAAGVYLTHRLRMPLFDAAASHRHRP
jgi:hypothetical protein